MTNNNVDTKEKEEEMVGCCFLPNICITILMPLLQGMVYFILSSNICIDNPYMNNNQIIYYNNNERVQFRCGWGQGLILITISIICWILSGIITFWITYNVSVTVNN